MDTERKTSTEQARPERSVEIYLPGDEGYDHARAGWDLSIDLRPAAVWVAHTVEQVQAAIAYARRNGLRIAPQTTGHLRSVLAPQDRELLLKPMLHHGQVSVDPAARVARVDSGAIWRDVVEAAAPHGLAAMHGSSPTVGVVGYLLGGGLSFYARAHGLAANHVLAFEVVTADGTFRRVDPVHEPELFFALRGGGAAACIVCSVELELLPYAQVTAGAMFFPSEAARELLGVWHDWTRTTPTSITTTFRRLTLPPEVPVPEPLQGVPTVCIDGVDVSPTGAAAAALERRLRNTAEPVMGSFARVPSSAALQIHGDPENPTPLRSGGLLLDDLDEQALDIFVRVTERDSPLLVAELRQLGGMVATPPANPGARSFLEGKFLLFGAGVVDAPQSASTPLDRYLDHYLNALRPWATGTGFSAFPAGTTELPTLPRAAQERVARARTAFDPDAMLVASARPQPTRQSP